MSDQEMQFADPDWKPTKPLYKNNGTQTPEEYIPRPINENIREQWQQPVREIPSEQEDAYAGLPPYAGSMAGQPGERYQYRRSSGRRRRSLWFWIILAILLLSFMSGGFGAFSRIGQKTLDDNHSFTVSGTPTIVIHDSNGNIRVHQVGTSNRVLIDATKETGLFDDPNNIHVNANQDPTNSNIINVTVDTGNSNTFSSRQVDFDVTVPQGVNLKLETSSGDISVNGVNGNASLTTGSGNISTSNDIFAANTVLKATSGDIQTSGDTFNVNSAINVTSGDISMVQDTLNGSASVTTSDGNIHFNGTVSSDQAYQYQFQADRGNIDIGVPGSSNFTFKGSTDSGHINIDGFPGQNVPPDDSGPSQQVTRQVGTGSGATLTIHVTDGNIHIYLYP